MNAQTLINECSKLGFAISFEALQAQFSLSSISDDIDDITAQSILASIRYRTFDGLPSKSNHGAASAPSQNNFRPQIRSAAPSSPETPDALQNETPDALEDDVSLDGGDASNDSVAERVTQDLKSFMGNGKKLTPDALATTAGVNEVSLAFAYEMAQTLQLDREELAILSGYVKQMNELALEELGRQVALLDYSESSRSAIASKKAALERRDSNIEAVQSRLGVDFCDLFNRAAKADQKARSKASPINDLFFQVTTKIGNPQSATKTSSPQ